MFARAITLQPREGVRQSCGRHANLIRPRICKCFEIHLLDGSRYLRNKKITPRLSNISADLIEGFASHTERLTMHLLAPCSKKMDGVVKMNSEDVGAMV